MLNPGMKTERKRQKQGREKEGVYGNKIINFCSQEDKLQFFESSLGLYILNTLWVCNLSLNQSSEVWVLLTPHTQFYS